MDVGDIIEAEMKTPKHEKYKQYFSPNKKNKNEDNDKKSRELFTRNARSDIRKSSLYNFILLGVVFIVIFYILKIRGCL